MPAADDLAVRERIRDAALNRFGRDGINRVTVRAIAADAGVSPALVIHHFGSKEKLRKACDAHVMALLRDGGAADARHRATLGDGSRLAALLEAAAPARRYLARAFLDGSPEAAALFDEIVEVTTAWLAEGERDGWARPTEHPRARAAIYVSWMLAPLTLSDHLERVLGVHDLADTGTAVDYMSVAIEMLTRGVFSGDGVRQAWRSLERDDRNDGDDGTDRADEGEA